MLLTAFLNSFFFLYYYYLILLNFGKKSKKIFKKFPELKKISPKSPEQNFNETQLIFFGFCFLGFVLKYCCYNI